MSTQIFDNISDQQKKLVPFELQNNYEALIRKNAIRNLPADLVAYSEEAMPPNHIVALTLKGTKSPIRLFFYGRFEDHPFTERDLIAFASESRKCYANIRTMWLRDNCYASSVFVNYANNVTFAIYSSREFNLSGKREFVKSYTQTHTGFLSHTQKRAEFPYYTQKRAEFPSYTQTPAFFPLVICEHTQPLDNLREIYDHYGFYSVIQVRGMIGSNCSPIADYFMFQKTDSEKKGSPIIAG